MVVKSDKRKTDAPEAVTPRPSLGPLFLAAVASWGAVVAVESFAWSHYAGEETGWPVAAGLAVLLLLGFIAGVRRRCVKQALTMLAPALVATLCVGTCSVLYWFAWEQNAVSFPFTADCGDVMILNLLSDPSQKDYGVVSEAETVLHDKTVRLRIKWPQGDEGLFAGHRIVATGSFRTPEDDAGGRWNHRQGFAGMLNVSSYEEKGCSDGLGGWVTSLRDSSFERIQVLGGRASGLLAGILLGNKTLYSGTELEQDFRVTGLAHLMAVSGTHLAVVTILALWLLRCLPFGRGFRSVLLAFLLLGYVALTAFAPSALRACAMCMVVLGASRFGRRKHVLSALSVCVVGFLALEPRLAFSLGFQLSVLCMVGLAVFSPLVSAWVTCLLPERFSNTSQVLAATLCTSLVTMPVTVPLFSQLPLVSPLSTLVASPLITLALGLGIAGLVTALACQPLGSVLLGLAGAVAEFAAWVVHGIACMPFACVPLDTGAPWLAAVDVVALLALWVLWPLPDERDAVRRLMTATVLVAPVALLLVIEFGGASAWLRAAGLSVSSDAQVIMLDVGQGDAMLVRDGDSAVLVDTGEEGTVLLKALARNGVGKLDAVALSHKDADHTGALSSLTGVVEVKHVFVHKDLVNDGVMGAARESADRATRGKGVEGVGVGSALKVGRFSLMLLSPAQGGRSENEDSLIWLLGFDEDGDGIPEATGLLTGDGEQEAIEGIVSQVGDISFLKVAHHGSKGAVSTEELKVLKPELALISVGAGNTYGHPTRSTLNVLGQAGCTVLRTDTSGDITLSFKGKNIGVKTQKRQ